MSRLRTLQSVFVRMPATQRRQALAILREDPSLLDGFLLRYGEKEGGDIAAAVQRESHDVAAFVARVRADARDAGADVRV